MSDGHTMHEERAYKETTSKVFLTYEVALGYQSRVWLAPYPFLLLIFRRGMDSFFYNEGILRKFLKPIDSDVVS